MRKTTFTNKMMNISVSEKCITILLFIFIFGLSTGAFFEIMMSADMKTTMQQYLQNLLFSFPQASTSSGSAFMNCLHLIVTSVPLILLIALFGCIGLGFPFASIVIFLKGISLGYTCTLILETLTFKGVFVIIFSVFPQNTLLIPAIILSAGFAVNQSPKLQYGKGKSFLGNLEALGTTYLYTHLFFCILAILGCILQSILLPICVNII